MESERKKESEDSYYKLPPIMTDNKKKRKDEEKTNQKGNPKKSVLEKSRSDSFEEIQEKPKLSLNEKVKFNQVVATGVKFIVRKCNKQYN